MRRTLASSAIHAALGLLVGLFAVAWIAPATPGGVAILLCICVLAALVLGRIPSAIRNITRSIKRPGVSEQPQRHAKTRPTHMPSIFISYRRDDAAADARQIYTKLSEALDFADIFMDVSTMGPGVRFKEEIECALDRCDVLLAVIGRTWFSEKHRARLKAADDYVRLEIQTALLRGIPVIPVLVNGAALPDSNALPEALRELNSYNAFRLRHESFDSDVAQLAEGVVALGVRDLEDQTQP